MVKKEISEIRLDGGLLCLEFVNSVPNRIEIPQPDYLADIHDLIVWARRLEVIDAKTERLLTREANKEPEAANFFFKEAIAFRECLYSVFWHVSAGKKIPRNVLYSYNQLVRSYFPFLQLKQASNKFIKDWQLEDQSLMRLIAPILNDSYETLLSDKLSRIKECGNCGWLFYDSSKNGKRRWCSMKTCGSNVKALQWYHRQKKQ